MADNPTSCCSSSDNPPPQIDSPPKGCPSPEAHPPINHQPSTRPCLLPPSYSPASQQALDSAKADETGTASTRLKSVHSAGSHLKIFNSRPKYNDVWAAVLFFLHLAAFGYVSYVGITSFEKMQKYHQERQTQLNSFTKPVFVSVLLIVALSAFCLSSLYFFFMRRYTSFVMKATPIMFITTLVTGGAISDPSASFVLFFCAVIGAVFWFRWRSRIPFATVMLQTVTAVSTKYKGTFGVVVLGFALQVAYSIYFIFTLNGIVSYAIVASESSTPPSTGLIVAYIIFMLFSYYWVAQVIKTVVHVANSGVFAAFYFLEGSTQGMPSSPTLKSLQRATTTSFGSICYGSLIMVAFSVLVAICRSATESCMFVSACTSCFYGVIEYLMQYFNCYAFSQVAIYGKDVRTAAKDTWALMKNRGIDAIINDGLVNIVLNTGSWIVGYLNGLFAFGLCCSLAYNAEHGFGLADLSILVVFAFLLGITMMNLVGEIISSGVITTFVALAEDPETLARTKPELYEKIRETYPQVHLAR